MSRNNGMRAVIFRGVDIVETDLRIWGFVLCRPI
jgi:hypothetical protein